MKNERCSQHALPKNVTKREFPKILLEFFEDLGLS
jgi:hypothetical protein